jgi:hypothetical protein
LTEKKILPEASVMLIIGWGVAGIVLAPAKDVPLELAAKGEGDGGESFDRFEKQHSPSVELGDCSMTVLLGTTLEISKFKFVLGASELSSAQQI